VAEAHRHGVVHGDLKSNNVILGRGPDGGVRAVITDFGLARWARRADLEAAPDLASEIAGTPGYMAPEVSAGQRPSPASDVYALGVILEEFAGENHPKWDRIIERCMQRDPEDRFTDGSGVEKALNPPQPRRLWLTAAVAVLLAAVSGALMYRFAKTPQESIRLGLTPVEAAPDLADAAHSIATGAASKFATLKGGARAKFRIAPPERATHIVHATLVREGSGLLLRAALTDTHTQANGAEMEFRYGLSEIHYAPVALAGMVTAALRLPPLPVPPVNNAAAHDYAAGIADARRNSTALRGVQELNRAIASDPDSPLTWAGLAQAEWQEYFVTRDPVWLRRCEESLREAKRRDPDAPPVHLISGRLYANAGSYERAETEYLRTIELDSRNADAYRRLGQVYLRVGRFDDARVQYQKAVEVEPQYYPACQDLGTFYRDRGELRNALPQFEKCVALAPEEPTAHWVLALVYKDLSRYADAEREARAALAISVTTNALVTLAVALAYQGKDADAIPYLLRATHLSPEQSLIWMNLGNAYARTHSAAKARAAFRTGLAKAEREAATDPRDGVVGARVALLCAHLGDQSRAEAEIARALQLSPDSDDTRETAIWTYEVLGERDQAIALLKNSRGPVFNFASQYPDLAELRADSRFKELADSRGSHQEKVNGK
jgi:serine/threonine-protein kinase